MVATLQSRKEALEAKILEKNEELKRLCLQEADLTGVIPPEIPLEPGEPPPTIRRRVGTSFSFPQNLINNIKDADEESLIALEVECKVQTNIAEAALTLANDTTVNKAARRKHRLMYRQSQRRLSELEARLTLLRQGKNDTSKPQQIKKKPRPNTTAVENLTYIWNKPQGQINNEYSGSNSVPWSKKRMAGYSKDELDGARDFVTGDIFGSLHRSYKQSGQTSKGSSSPKPDIDNDGNNMLSLNGTGLSSHFLLASSYPSSQDITGNKSANKGGGVLHQKRSPKRSIVRRQWDTQSAGGTLLPNQTYPDHCHQPNLSRTQSLGSVESNSQRPGKGSWSALDFPLEGNTSKEKEWYETSVDSAPSPPLRTSSRLPSTARLLYQMQEQQSREWNGYVTPNIQSSNSQLLLPATHRSVIKSQSYQPPEKGVNEDLATSMQLMSLNHNKRRTTNLFLKDSGFPNTHLPIQTDYNAGYNHPDSKPVYEYFKSKDQAFYVGEMKMDIPQLEALKMGNLGLVSQNSTPTQTTNLDKHEDLDLMNLQSHDNSVESYKRGDAVFINIPEGSSELRPDIANWMNETEFIKSENKPEYPQRPKTVSQPYYHSSKLNNHIGKIDNLQYQAARNRQNATEHCTQFPAHHPPHAITQNEITFDTVVPFESPQNHTVVQAGKWQPYREVTKPFEMSDFYKYSTKFRHNSSASSKSNSSSTNNNNNNNNSNNNNNDNNGNNNNGGNESNSHSNNSNTNNINNNNNNYNKTTPIRAPTPDASRNSPNTNHQKGVYTPLRPMTCQPVESKHNYPLPANHLDTQLEDEIDHYHMVEVSLPEIV